MKSPNDQDPPDYVTGDTDEEAFYEKVYEKFPWLQDIDEMLNDDATYSGEPNGGVQEMLTFVTNEAIRYGMNSAVQDAGEYMQHMETELAIAGQAKESLQKILGAWDQSWAWSSEGETT